MPARAKKQAPDPAVIQREIQLQKLEQQIRSLSIRRRTLETLSRLLPAAERAARRGKPALLRLVLRYGLRLELPPTPGGRTP